MLLGLLLVCVGWHTTPGGTEVVASFEGMLDWMDHCSETCSVVSRLVRSSLPPEMTLEEDLLKKQVTLAELEKSQAVLKDYKNLIDYNRGHLNPNGHQPDLDAKKSTFTLTNTVPQYKNLNGGSWANYEDKTMKVKTQGCKDTFAIVGAVPGNKYIAGKRVNQPSHLWSAACCYIDNNRIRSWAVIARNDKDAAEDLTLGQLEGKLAELYQQNSISLFHSDCPRQ